MVLRDDFFTDMPFASRPADSKRESGDQLETWCWLGSRLKCFHLEIVREVSQENNSIMANLRYQYPAKNKFLAGL